MLSELEMITLENQQCYEDDDIFFFGFSRGAYVARFLAEMLDHVGLLSSGNEEMIRFAWKAFAQWQQREENTAKEKQKKKEMLDFLLAFRETFSRPVRRIRFLGLFDTGKSPRRCAYKASSLPLNPCTVNSVPRFESAWMQRSKFPYTARSSARVIRHAVSIDERRAKFRSDLISEAKTSRPNQHQEEIHREKSRAGDNWMTDGSKPSHLSADRFRRRAAISSTVELNRVVSPRLGPVEQGYADHPRNSSYGQLLTTSPAIVNNATDAASIATSISVDSYQPGKHPDEDNEDDDEAAEQDIEELWFPGCHADLGGGWPLAEGEESALSHGPLVWMVREAQRAGLEFDQDMLLRFKCCDESYNIPSFGTASDGPSIPKIRVRQPFSSPKSEKQESGCMYLFSFDAFKPGQFDHVQEQNPL